MDYSVILPKAYQFGDLHPNLQIFSMGSGPKDDKVKGIYLFEVPNVPCATLLRIAAGNKIQKTELRERRLLNAGIAL